MTVDAIECVAEIKFHQHMIMASMAQGISILNGWLPRNFLAYRLQADLDRNIPQSVNVNRICALRRHSPKIAIEQMPKEFLFMVRRRPPKKIGPSLKGSVLTRPD